MNLIRKATLAAGLGVGLAVISTSTASADTLPDLQTPQGLGAADEPTNCLCMNNGIVTVIDGAGQIHGVADIAAGAADQATLTVNAAGNGVTTVAAAGQAGANAALASQAGAATNAHNQGVTGVETVVGGTSEAVAQIGAAVNLGLGGGTDPLDGGGDAVGGIG